MKKTCNVTGKIFCLLLITCLFLFNTGCGLDTFYMIDAPYSVIHQPTYDNIDYSYRYFDFWTNETVEIEGFDFRGTEVYYKIYNNYSQMSSEISTLQSLANDSEKNVTAADKMINPTDSGGYAYKELKVSGKYESPLIPATGVNQRIYIRLTDYQSMPDYSARICTIQDGEEKYLYESESKTIPVRNSSDIRTFNFGRSGQYDTLPTKDDNDVKIDTENKSEYWYVAMFAVAVGYDYTFAVYRSNILYLGSVRIDATSQDN